MGQHLVSVDTFRVNATLCLHLDLDFIFALVQTLIAKRVFTLGLKGVKGGGEGVYWLTGLVSKDAKGG